MFENDNNKGRVIAPGSIFSDSDGREIKFHCCFDGEEIFFLMEWLDTNVFFCLNLEDAMSLIFENKK